MQKYLFIDRDGTLIVSPPSPLQIDHIEKLQFYPFVITWLGKIIRELDYKLVMVTNQNGLGTVHYPLSTFYPAQNFMLNVFKNEGILFSDIIIDPSYPSENSPNRKPRIGRMTNYLQNELVDMQHSFVIGDRYTDIQFAKNLGCKGILLNPGNQRGISECTDPIALLTAKYTALASSSWEDIYRYLKNKI